MRPIIDMTGKRIGKWTVLSGAGHDKNRQSLWLCRCECGREVAVNGYNLRRGKSEGCKSCARRLAATKHGGKGTRLYRIWRAMRKRCGDENDKNFKNYGGRGIKACKEWDESFVAFRDWALANGYADDLSIDRIDNDSGYGPENCRWVTSKTQSRNRRNNVHVTIDKITRTIAGWAEIAGISHSVLLKRYNKGWRGECLLYPMGSRQ